MSTGHVESEMKSGELGPMEPGFHSVAEAMRPAIYMLVYKGKVMYIGQSSQPLVRLCTHLRTKKVRQTTFGPRMLKTIPFDDIWIKPCATDQLLEVEKGLIQKYRPQFNTRQNGEPKIAINFKDLVRSIAPIRSRGMFHPTIGHVERRI